MPLGGVDENITTREEGKKKIEGGSNRFAVPYKQLELGKVEAFRMHREWKIVIVAEYWPSWIMAIQGEFLAIKCYCTFRCLKAKAEFSAT